MVAIDTNILIRFFEIDPLSQFEQFKKLIKYHKTVFISHIVLVEFVWVCKSSFKLNKSEICDRLKAIINAIEFEFVQKQAVESALEHYAKNKGDFSDYLIAETNLANGCETTLTFDVNVSKCSTFTLVER